MQRLKETLEIRLLQPPLTQNPNDDYALMRAITAGDAAAFKTFYARHSAAVYTLCLRMLRDAQEAEQLLTDVFFEIWTSRGRYDETRSNPLTYLMRITRSRAIDKLRRKGPVSGVSLDPGSGIDVAIDDAPSTVAEADESRIIVANALRILDVEQRRVIECSYYEGLSHAQIATKLNKPLGTVKSCMRQGLVRLRELLSRSHGTESEQPL
jgi:RNA polymerase sigma-70 factor, ECF subfamily